MEEKEGYDYEKRELFYCEGGKGFKPEIDIVNEEGEYRVIVLSTCERGVVVQERYTLRGCEKRHMHVLWRKEEPSTPPILFDDYAKWSFPGVSKAGVEPGGFELGEEEEDLATILEKLSLPPISFSRPVTCAGNSGSGGGGSDDGVTCEVVWEGSRVSVYVTRRIDGPLDGRLDERVRSIPLSTNHEVAVLSRVGEEGEVDSDPLVHGVLVTLERGKPSVRETLFVHTPFAVAEPQEAWGLFRATLVQPGGSSTGGSSSGGSSTAGGAYLHPILEWEFSEGDSGRGASLGSPAKCTPHVQMQIPKEYIVDPHTLPKHCHVSPVHDIELPAYRVNSSTATTTVHSNALNGSLQLHLRYIGGSNGDNGTALLPPVQILPFWECPLDDDTAVAVKSSFYTDTGRLLYPLNDNYSNRLYALPMVSLRAQMITGPMDARATSVDLATTVIVAMASFYLLLKLFKGVSN